MKDFTSEPMGEKPVKTLAGIGEVLGNKLIEEVSYFETIFVSFLPYFNVISGDKPL